MARKESYEIVNDYTAQRLEDIAGAKQRALEKIGLIAEGYAKRLCPVDTGKLRNSITHTSDGKYAYIGTNVEYAKYIEYGTSSPKRPARPYLRPAASEHMEEYKQILEKELKNGG